MENQIQTLLNKYETKPLNSIKFEENVLDIEKNIILEKESQIPNFVLASNCPFDKNYCFSDINLTVSTKENIFPKEKYFLKSQQIIELKPVDINKIFSDDKMFKNEKISPSGGDINSTDDDNSVHKKIISTIESHHYKNYIPKRKYSEQYEVNNEWYIIGNNKNEGPFNDYLMYNKLYQIYNECISKKEKVPNYLINEKRSDTFMTMDDCFDRLKTKFEYNKQNINSPNKLMLQYMNNMMIYRNQMIQQILMNQKIPKNSPNNQINQNKITVPNKFDNNNSKTNNENNKINANKINNNDEKKEKDNKSNNYNNYRWNNYKHRGSNKFNNNNYHHDKYSKKEKRYKENEVKENKDVTTKQNEDGKVENKSGNNTVEENKEEESKKIEGEDIEEFFKNKEPF